MKKKWIIRIIAIVLAILFVVTILIGPMQALFS